MTPRPGGSAARTFAAQTHTVQTRTVQTFTVRGMTCHHCVLSVTEEVQELPGVADVAVDLATGALTLTSDQPLSDADVRAAVDEAGYRLA